jgi:hypothetical protein
MNSGFICLSRIYPGFQGWGVDDTFIVFHQFDLIPKSIIFVLL